MSRNSILTILITISLLTMACGLTINIPVDEVTTGPMETEEVNIAAPDSSVADLTLVFGAGELTLAPGAGSTLVAGTAQFNVPDFKPKVKTSGSNVRFETGSLEISGIPKVDNTIKNIWDLKLGNFPMDLTINAGAYQGNFELGGLSLKSLEIAEGAADVNLKFSSPNTTEMELFRYTTAASNVKLYGLANANFTSMIFRSGAGDYLLDFTGDLKRNAVVTVESGFSQVIIVVPSGTAARISYKGGLAGISTSGDWKKSGDLYTLDGDGPVLTINVDIGAGNLILRTVD